MRELRNPTQKETNDRHANNESSMPNDENKRKHLEMIQGIINRMAGNLFYLRGWTITLVTGLFALSASQGAGKGYFWLAYFLLLIFWILDGYFLSQERLFRELYDNVRQRSEDEIDFSMRTDKYKKSWKNRPYGAMFSATLLWFYVPLSVAMLVVIKVISP